MSVDSIGCADSYLHWIKTLENSLGARTDVYRLYLSGVYEPAALVDQMLDDLSQAWRARNPWGHPDLIDRIRSEYIPRHSDLHVLPTDGATGAIRDVCAAMIAPGDHVIVEHPVYEPLLQVPQRLGAIITRLPRAPDDDYRIDCDHLKRLVSPRTRLVILSNLHNPSGAHLSAEDLHTIAKLVTSVSSQATIVVDETCLDFVSGGVSAATLHPSFISISSLSKCFGLGALRCGWIVASSDLFPRIRKSFDLLKNCNSPVTESLALRALARRCDLLIHQQTTVQSNRRALLHYLDPLLGDALVGSVPSNGCLYFPRIAGNVNPDRLIQWLANHCRVYVAPGRFFGAPDHIRIGFGGKPETTAVGLQQLAAALRDWRHGSMMCS